MSATEQPVGFGSVAGVSTPDTTPAGRSAVVLGASRGIGRAIADRLVAAGHRVATLDRTAAPGDDRLAVSCDIADGAAVDAAFAQVEAEHGPAEILVVNAGITRDGLLMRMPDADWDDVIDVNLTGAFRAVRRASRAMAKQRYGRIVLISSVVGVMGGPGQVNYAASKAGMIGLARSVARELGPRGVTANVVVPGFIETAMTEGLSPELREKYRDQVPLGRFGSVDDVAAAVSFLVSDEAAYVTGAVLPVAGGLGMGS